MEKSQVKQSVRDMEYITHDNNNKYTVRQRDHSARGSKNTQT